MKAINSAVILLLLLLAVGGRCESQPLVYHIFTAECYASLVEEGNLGDGQCMKYVREH